MFQQIIVALIVIAAAWVVLRKYLPKPLRRRTAAVIAAFARRAGAAPLSRWLETDLPAASSCADGCGSCGNCATPPVPATSPISVAAAGAGAIARPETGVQAGTGQGSATGAPTFSITPDALRKTIRRH